MTKNIYNRKMFRKIIIKIKILYYTIIIFLMERILLFLTIFMKWLDSKIGEKSE